MVYARVILGSLFFLWMMTLPGLAQQSTTGPVPPPGIDRGFRQFKPMQQVVISGVPKYLWHHGCGPTAVGMVVGYWDGLARPDLVPGDASTQTAAVEDMIAEDSGIPVCGFPYSDHHQDYSCPRDYSPNPLQSDRSQTGGAHANNCVGDFMFTSRSANGNYYGWSWFSHVPGSFINYANLVDPGAAPQASNYNYAGFSFDDYKIEIDQGRPVVLLVDTDGNSSTDHFVTGIGYDDVAMEYAIHDTWDMQVHWYDWRQMGIGRTWGIYGVTTFSCVYSPCDCGIWGDVTGDGNINPVDVVFMVNRVYLDNDMVTQHPDCPRDAGDINCDDNVNPVDVVFFVNRVYLDNDMFCADPCD